jgi:predicted AAA+ superfamily ATPase
VDRWRKGHLDVILRQDLLDLERVREIRNIEILIELLSERVGSTVSLQSLAENIGTSSHTIKHWLEILERLFVIFKVSPYSKNISAAMKKESKYYFYDVGQVANGEAARLENTVACALLAEISLQEDTAGKKGTLHFIRNKQKQEVDFLVLINKSPKLLVEVKQSDDNFCPSLLRFFENLKSLGLIAFQVVGRLSRQKEKSGAHLVSAVDFLRSLK